ncbi:hypothetical protein BDF20DRAFT_876216 [Mycotypha africana]|uniref:uncharacterized protein n=1 Tax=Mycotypha africana TaxID=64632 RepID=UPI0023017720|nr:uncharacterized protein BDF20DRAFT_876216 [Mycotypha africana]KAI8977668.1 hypothetical protein BDF20DRAFT_876216 [Mycotypha africana]
MVFGDGMFNKSSVHLKGLRAGIVGVLWRVLKRRVSTGDLLVITIVEYLTLEHATIAAPTLLKH